MSRPVIKIYTPRTKYLKEELKLDLQEKHIDYLREVMTIVETKDFKNKSINEKKCLLAKCCYCGKIKGNKCLSDCCNNYYHKKCKKCECNHQGSFSYQVLIVCKAMYDIMYKKIGDKNMKYDIPLINFEVKDYNKNITSLEYALKQQGLNFCNEINYEKFAENMKTNKENITLLNNCKLEPCYKYAGEKIKNAYNKMKELTSNKIYPIEIKYKEDVGYYVIASQEIQKNTLICEYTGDFFPISRTLRK